jgi:hypothetical protein
MNYLKQKIDSINVDGTLHALDGAIKVVWDASSNMDEMNITGLYYITGNRSNTADNMPMNNTGDIVAWMRVANVDAVNSFLTQILELGNKDGGEIKVYTRRYNGSSWSAWQMLQPMTEVGQVDSLDGFIDNGMYSGALTNGDTFTIIVINNYAVAASASQERSISQFKYSLALSGGVQFQHRTGKGAAAIAWSEWQNVGEERLPIVDESQLDNIGGDMSQFLDAITNLGARYYTVTSTARKIVVGKMEIISDNNMHGVTQILKTHYLLNEDGTLNLLAHNHNELYIYTRIWDRSSKSWSKWVEYKEDIRKSIQEIHEFLNSDFLEQTYAYGVEWDTSVTTPECTRIGSMNLHRSLPVQSGMRGCLLNDNGVVVEYLPADDWTTAVRDGSKGQVMVEIPKHYRKFVTDGTKRQVWLSMMPLAGYHEVPKAFVGAYEAALDRTNLKLASVVNTTEQYRGGKGTAAWDGTYRSLLGKPMTGNPNTNNGSIRFSVGQHLECARKRNSNTTEWNSMTYDIYKEIVWLFVVEYATRNSQATLTTQLTSEGFKQGGLGEGATTVDNTAWNTYNERTALLDCGVTDALGNGTGEVDIQMPTELNSIILKANRYRGIENPFGHVACCLEGVLLLFETTDADYADVYLCSNHKFFVKDARDASALTNYTKIGQIPNSKGYDWFIKDIMFGDGGELLTIASDRSSNQNFCDVYSSMGPGGSPSALRYVTVGGYANENAWAGFFSNRNSYNGYYLADSRMGTRLCFIPEK